MALTSVINMKKIIVTLLAMMVMTAAQAQLLYKISGNELEKPSYIVGTYHLASANFAMKIKGIMGAINATEQVYGEVNTLELDAPANKARIQNAKTLPNNQKITDVLTAEQAKKVNAFMKEMLGADMSNEKVANKMGRMTPVALTAEFVSLLYLSRNMGSFDPMNLIDGYFQRVAKKNNEPVGGLETIEEQTELLYRSMDMERQIELLMCVIDNQEYNINIVQRLLQAYTMQDIDAVKALLDEKQGTICDSTPQEDEAMIYKRNTAWVEKMPAIMTDKPTLFVVGVGHLPGDKGVLALLKDKGYTVEPVQE